MMLVRGDDDILNSLAIPISISRGASVWWSTGQECVFVWQFHELATVLNEVQLRNRLTLYG